MSKEERPLKLFLRIIGTVALFAVVAVVMPYSWMNAIHQWLRMGQFPSAPVVGYLARSTSAFYALFGGLLWLTSCDLKRHRLVLLYLAAAIIIFVAALFVVDLLEGMPLHWSLTEGPVTVTFGIVILVLSYRIGVELSE